MNENKIIGYDPMTGDPVYEKPAAETGYNPMTTTPMMEFGADSNTPVKNKKNIKDIFKAFMSNKLLVVLSSIAAVVAIVLIVVFSGIFDSDHTKVLKAVNNTFKDGGKLGKACQGLELLSKDSFTLTVNADIEGQEIEGTFAKNKNAMQLKGRVDIEGYPEVEATLGIDSDEEEVYGKVNLLDNTLFVYDYTGNNDGYLMSNIDKSQIDMINSMLESISKNEEMTKDIRKAALKEFEEWDIEKIDKEEFEVDGKDRKCAGYALTITGKDLENLIKAIFDVYEEYNIDFMDAIADVYEENDMELTDDFDGIFDGMEDIEIEFYIYKSKLAAVVFEVDGTKVEILFEGGKFRTQNIAVKVDKTTVAELKGETDGAVEEYELVASGITLGSLEYDSKSGDIEIEVMNGLYGDKISLEANLKGDKNKFEFSMDMDEFGVDGEVNISLNKGGKVSKPSGKEFNIGTADRDDLNDLVNDLSNSVDLEDMFDLLY